MKPSHLDRVEQYKKLTNQQKTIQEIENDFVKFNESIGLPLHPETFQPMKLMPYQTGFFKTITESQYHKFHVNKARQIGFTELIIRILLFQAFYKYKGGKILVYAGTRLDTTRDIFNRMYQLLGNLKPFIEDYGGTKIKFKNGTEILGLPANPESVTGLTKIKAVFMDEAAKWNLKEDLPVMNAIMPIVRSNHSDLFMISTPKGPRGFFYEIDKGENDFKKFKYDIYTVQGLLYTEKQIEEMLNSSIEDSRQEYLNEYVAGRDSFYGELTEQNREEFDVWE